MEQGIAPTEHIAEQHRCDAGHKNGKQRGHGEVYHQHLEREHQTSDGGLEDACDGSRGATSHQYHELMVVEMEEFAEVAADGRTCQDNRSLSSHATSEADGYGRCDDRAPAVVLLDAALLS